MKNNQDYIQDIAEIRSMMERSSKFLSLSGLAGVMAGMYALAGAFIAWRVLDFNPQDVSGSNFSTQNLLELVLLAIAVLGLALGTAVFYSYTTARKRGEKLWNPTSRRLLAHMAVPFVAGGFLVVILLSKDLTGLMPPVSMLFYGLALYNAGKFTYEEVKILGLVNIILGLAGAYFVEHSLAFWALGFGVGHIVYGVYMHLKYER